MQHFPSTNDEVAEHETKQDQAQAMAEIEAKPRIPHRGLGGDAHRGSPHGCLQLFLNRVERVCKGRVLQMYGAEK